MKTPSDHWRDLADADAVEMPLQPDERAFLEEYADDEDVARERTLYDEIARLGEPGEAREEDRARAQAALAELAGRRRGVSRWAVAAITGVVAAAAAGALWIYAQPSELSPDTVAQPRVADGSFMLAESRIEAGEPMPAGEWVRATKHACVDLHGGRACFGAGSELRILDGMVELREGLMQVDAGSVSLMDDQGIRALEAGESLDLTPREVAKVEAREALPPAAPKVEREADEAPRGKARPKAGSGKGAGQMLAEARHLANKGRLGEAVQAYGALRRAHPGSAEAHAANVSIGQLQLRRGKVSAGLSAFDRYLSRGGGALAEEARWGRVEALQRLGKKGARDRAIDRLLAEHPHSVYAPKAKALRGH
jgi:hypothetical protein